jgi:uncharacterized membrane protein YeiH
MDVPPGFDPTLILWLNLAGTFVFGISGGLAAARARLDFFGVIVLAAVVGLAGGIMRDLLIGTPPATFRDWRYLAAVGAAGLICFVAAPRLEQLSRQVLLFDALGLAVASGCGCSACAVGSTCPRRPPGGGPRPPVRRASRRRRSRPPRRSNG